MIFEHSRRDFLKQGSLLALSGGVLLSGVLRTALAQARFVEAVTSFGRVRSAEVGAIKTFKGVPYGASTAGANRFGPHVHPPKWNGEQHPYGQGPREPH